MTPLKLLSTYLLTATAFFAIDMLWLGVVAKDFYRKQLGGLLSEQVNWGAAMAFYLLFIAGILIFAVYPGLAKDSLRHTVLMGALLGLLCYATYDLTNLATLKNWPIAVVAVDMLWGAFLSAAVSGIGFYIAKWIH